MPGGDVLLRLRGVRKEHGGLRPLRMEAFELRAGETVGLVGFDRSAAEALVNLITGATLPDAGLVEIFGRPTSDIADADTWLRSLDSFGLLSDRVVLVEELSIAQNLALPLSFEVAEMAPELRVRIEELAAEVNLSSEDMQQPLPAAGADTRQRIRLAKALALNPGILLAEHPNAAVPPHETGKLASDLARIAARRRMAMLVLTADAAFARAACEVVLTWQPATGELAPAGWWARWVRSPRGSRTQP